MYLATIKADRIVVRYEQDYRFGDACIKAVNSISKKYTTSLSRSKVHKNSLANLGKGKSSSSMSATSKRTLRDTIQLLYQLSTPRKVCISKDRYIYNYRASFITLTLPSTQLHSDVEIKQCLNYFFNNLRSSMGVSNYVWKAELQQSSNIHFHIVLDKYCSYQSLRYYWNKSIERLGYVSNYSLKFSSMTLLQYAKHRDSKVELVKAAYIKGVKSNWSSPNTVTVNSLNSSKQLAFYLSKYMTKDFKNTNVNNVDSERVKSFGKVWSRSGSLSCIKLITRWDWNRIYKHIKPLMSKSNVVIKQYDYCTIYYFQFLKKIDNLVKWLRNNITNQAMYYNYPFPYVPNK